MRIDKIICARAVLLSDKMICRRYLPDDDARDRELEEQRRRKQREIEEQRSFNV